MITENIKKQIIEAMKARDELRMSTLKMLSSALHNAEIAKRGGLNEEEELEIVRREAKKRKDAIEIYKKLQNSKTPNLKIQEKINREKNELEILKRYLPEQLSDQELEKFVGETISETGVKDVSEMGKVIGQVMEKVKGRAEGGKVAAMVKSKLN